LLSPVSTREPKGMRSDDVVIVPTLILTPASYRLYDLSEYRADRRTGASRNQEGPEDLLDNLGPTIPTVPLIASRTHSVSCA
jgi:hypothetical protein